VDIAIERFVTGLLETNTYVVSHDSACLVIDPSGGCGAVSGFIKEQGFVVEAICLTHGHFDHFIGVEEIRRNHQSPAVWAHPAEEPLLTNSDYNGSFMIGKQVVLPCAFIPLVEGENAIGSFKPIVLHLPGHSPGGVAFVFGKHCLSGDSLFAGSIGRYDFPLCDGEALMEGIQTKLFALPDDTIVYPGHGNRTTIGREKRSNPYFR
jgi:hydroxyacylglutathione hydrolase